MSFNLKVVFDYNMYFTMSAYKSLETETLSKHRLSASYLSLASQRINSALRRTQLHYTIYYRLQFSKV